MRLQVTLLAGLVFLANHLVAAEPKPIKLAITRQAIESPVLKYRLLPPESEIKAGNAVPILLRFPWDYTPWMTEVYPTLREWVDRPLNDPRWKNFDEAVLPERFYEEMKRAAFRRDAFWEYPITEVSSPYLILLPDVQGLRGFLEFGLCGKTRYHLSRHETDKAREVIMVGMANARHVAQTPFYVCQLAAIRIQQNLLNCVDELISEPGSPNLYWALSFVPYSLADMNRAANLESSLFAMTFPSVNDFDRPRNPSEWQKMANQLVQFLEELGDLPAQTQKENGDQLQEGSPPGTPPATSRLAKSIPQARSELSARHGFSTEKVAAMTDDEVVIRWHTSLRIDFDHHRSAVMALPPREAWPELIKLESELKSIVEKTGVELVGVPTATDEYLMTWSLKRKVQMLRVIEAVRHDMSRHDGRLPASLSDIADVPIPLDPMTNQPFIWKVENQAATLLAPGLPTGIVQSGKQQSAAKPIEYTLSVE